MNTCKPVLSAKEIAIDLIDSYWVKVHSSNTFSVIASYKYQLDAIEERCNCKLVNYSNSAGGLTVWGEFSIK